MWEKSSEEQGRKKNSVPCILKIQRTLKSLLQRHSSKAYSGEGTSENQDSYSSKGLTGPACASPISLCP